MNWTSKQSLSLAGAIGIQIAICLLLSDQWRYLPGVYDVSPVVSMVQARLVAKGESASAQSLSDTAVTDTQVLRESSVAIQTITDSGSGAADASSDTPVQAPHGLMDYLPASQLTERPVVLADIDPELSGRFAFIHPQSLTLTLLINEYGDVDRVLLSERKAGADGREENALPAVLLNDLIQRFLDMRFLPGRLNGQAVRSALTIRASLGP